MLEYALNLTSVFASKKVNGVGLDGDSRLTLTQHKYIHPFSALLFLVVGPI